MSSHIHSTLLEQGNVEGALEKLTTAFELKPTDAVAAFNFGNVLLQSSKSSSSEAEQSDTHTSDAKLRQAASAFTKAVESAPRHGKAWASLGIARQRLHECDSAKMAFDRAEEVFHADAAAAAAAAVGGGGDGAYETALQYIDMTKQLKAQTCFSRERHD
jgi:Flp pilus assembly protein TadD